MATAQATIPSLALAATLGVVIGALATRFILKRRDYGGGNGKISPTDCTTAFLEGEDSLVSSYAVERRARLPELIVLVRHGESEGNADQTLYRSKPDHLVNLTQRGVEQAFQTGERIEQQIFRLFDRDSHLHSIRRVHLTVSPFERTLQTAAALRTSMEHRIVRTDVEPRIREQEFGNVQTEEFAEMRREQQEVGRFCYRFPTGESGADVHDRVKSWWFESVLSVNDRVGYPHVDALVVVTHGLTMRFVLMQLYGWSPTTFHTVWNAGNCDVYVLRKNLHKPGLSPYVLDPSLGDMPKSSIDVVVESQPNPDTEKSLVTPPSTTGIYTIQDYLSLPSPRTRQFDALKEKLLEQYPSEFASENSRLITKVTPQPFMQNVGSDRVWELIQRRAVSSLSSISLGMESYSSTASSSSSIWTESTPSFAQEVQAEANYLGEGERDLTSAIGVSSNRREGLVRDQEFSCRIPENDYWITGGLQGNTQHNAQST